MVEHVQKLGLGWSRMLGRVSRAAADARWHAHGQRQAVDATGGRWVHGLPRVQVLVETKRRATVGGQTGDEDKGGQRAGGR